MLPRNLNDSTAVTVLFIMVHDGGGRAGGFLLKSAVHLHGFEVVNTAPDSQLVTILNEADDCGVIYKYKLSSDELYLSHTEYNEE